MTRIEMEFYETMTYSIRAIADELKDIKNELNEIKKSLNSNEDIEK